MVFDESIALKVCLRISQGETLRAICEDSAMPSHQTVYRWVAVEPTFRTDYARAREAQMEGWADDIVEIADDATNDYMERIGKGGAVERVVDPETVQRSKLRLDARKWLMSKLASRRYGDKVSIDLDANMKVESMTDAELEAKTAMLLQRLGIEAAGPLLIQAEETDAE